MTIPWVNRTERPKGVMRDEGPGSNERRSPDRGAGSHVAADSPADDGSAIVVDPDGSGVGIITERDVLYAIGSGLDPDVERTVAHQTSEVVYAAPDWTVAEAARAMVRGGFRHLVVLDGDDVLGVISVRDVLRVWAEQQLRGEPSEVATTTA